MQNTTRRRGPDVSGRYYSALYHDGVTEAINEREEMFEVERLVSVIKETKDATARKNLEKMIGSVFQFGLEHNPSLMILP